MPILELRNLNKSYPDGWTLTDVSFTVEEEEVLSLLGPSGCGKTTLLRLIAGLEMPDSGQVLVDGKDVTYLAPHRRGFGLMFQEYALFPHRDVFGNVAFGLRMERLDRGTIVRRVTETLALVGLEGFEHRDVNQLSGGERQRVALARSLAPQPRLLMLDEPLGALDRALRQRLMDELPQILHQAGVTVIAVTHDQEEAFAIADRVALMRAGELVQMGTPHELYRRPGSPWIARFLGLTNLLDARVVGPGQVETALGTLQVDDLEFGSWDSGVEQQLLIRPEAARLTVDGPNRVDLEIEACSFRGDHNQLDARHRSGVQLTFSFSAGVDLPPVGRITTLSLDPDALRLL
ncbi:MAG: ABC transporter ATP-binding protein [Anaerolineae bacterium]|jgi:ABC-type Fe3+/spermidine/putrescine transport system ATPase subunit